MTHILNKFFLLFEQKRRQDKVHTRILIVVLYGSICIDNENTFQRQEREKLLEFFNLEI